MNRIFAFFVVLIVLSCGEDRPVYIKNENHGAALGTSYNLTYFSLNQPLDLQERIDSTFTVINNSLSTYQADSDLSKINDGNDSIQVDDMFREVFELSEVIYKDTEGYFDPTVGLLVNAWGFGSEEPIQMDSTEVARLLARVGFDKVRLSDAGFIEKDVDGIYLEFNAVAKGYSVDRLAKLMDDYKIDNYLLEVGGELVAKGQNVAKQKEWVVGIDDPEVENGRQLKTALKLKNRALASSGNYRHFRIDETTGKRYVHTIDPQTGFTKNANTLAVTVLADNCATADAYATAFMAMDLDDALKLISGKKELDAYIVYVDSQGNTQEFVSEGFQKLRVSIN